MPMTTMPMTKDEWLSFQVAGRREGVSRFVVARLAREGRVAVRQLPGGRPEGVARGSSPGPRAGDATCNRGLTPHRLGVPRYEQGRRASRGPLGRRPLRLGPGDRGRTRHGVGSNEAEMIEGRSPSIG